jgi:hypothetical protein
MIAENLMIDEMDFGGCRDRMERDKESKVI